MITSKHISSTCEEWVSAPKVRGIKIDVYENPGSTDYKELNKNTNRGIVRFIADAKSKKVFVWDAYLATHFDVADKLRSEGRIGGSTYRDTLLRGQANLSGGSSKMTDTDTFGNMDALEKAVRSKQILGVLTDYFVRYDIIFDTDWSWVSKYVNCQYLVDMKNRFDKIKALYQGQK